jgi:hypothetical protein
MYRINADNGKTELEDSADKEVGTGATGEATKIWTKEEQSSGGY